MKNLIHATNAAKLSSITQPARITNVLAPEAPAVIGKRAQCHVLFTLFLLQDVRCKAPAGDTLASAHGGEAI